MKITFIKISAAMAFSASCLMGSAIAAEAGTPENLQSAPIPADLKRFTKEFEKVVMSKDLDRIMAYYSDQYLQDGRTKPQHREFMGTWVPFNLRFNIRITGFKPIDKNRAYITAQGESSFATIDKKPDYQMIRENGKWRWLGNQKPAAN